MSPSRPVAISNCSALSGSGNLIKEGGGYLKLNNDTSAYTGTITINGGIVQLLQSMTPAGAAPTVIVNSGTTLRNENQRTCTNWNLQLNDGSTLYCNANANSHSYFVGGTAQVTGMVTFNVNSGSNGMGHYDGDLSGNGTIVLTVSQSMIGQHSLGGENSAFTGTINIPTGTILYTTGATALGSGLTVVGGTLAPGFDLNAGNARIEGGRITNANQDRTLGAGLTVN